MALQTHISHIFPQTFSVAAFNHSQCHRLMVKTAISPPPTFKNKDGLSVLELSHKLNQILHQFQ